jgi:Toprim-like
VTWLDDAARTEVVTVAADLGLELRRATSSTTCACPACGAKTRHASRHDRRGAVGIAHRSPFGWRCFACGAGGDAPDFVAFALEGARFRDLGTEQRQNVRAWFVARGAGVAPVARPSAPPSPRAPSFPPSHELGEVWLGAGSVDTDPHVAEYLRWRALDATAVAGLDLARALARVHDLPAWACLGARTWLATGHRLLVPLYDAQGVLRSVLARSIERAPLRKSTAPRGYERSGLVMANAAGLALLERGEAEAPTVVIREGEIDYLATATEYAGPVFGIVAGAWTAAHAARVKDGMRVIIANDDDPAGDGYAAAIARTFQGRRVRLTRDRRAA